MSAPITEAMTLTQAIAELELVHWDSGEAVRDMGHDLAPIITAIKGGVAEWESKAATWLASPEAAQRLQGYRELAAKCAELEGERDEARIAQTASEKRVQELEPAAECWAALAASGRTKIMGAAGLHPDSETYGKPKAHIGIELWTHHTAKGDAQDIHARKFLGRFMEKCLAAYRATGAKP